MWYSLLGGGLTQGVKVFCSGFGVSGLERKGSGSRKVHGFQPQGIQVEDSSIRIGFRV